MSKTSYTRINITLPKETLNLVDSVTEKGERSDFINTAVLIYSKQQARARMNQRLKEGAIARREDDSRIAEEWTNIEEYESEKW